MQLLRQAHLKLPPKANAADPANLWKYPSRLQKDCSKSQPGPQDLWLTKGETQPAPRKQKQLARNAPTAGSVHRVKTAAPAKIVLQETTVAHVKTAAHAKTVAHVKTVDHVKTGQPTPNADRARTVDHEKTAGNGATAARAKTEAHAKTDQ